MLISKYLSSEKVLLKNQHPCMRGVYCGHSYLLHLHDDLTGVARYFKEHVQTDSVAVHVVPVYKSTNRQMPRSDNVSNRVPR